MYFVPLGIGFLMCENVESVHGRNQCQFGKQNDNSHHDE